MMIPVCLVFLAVSNMATGAPSSPPVFRNECKEPSMNDCPPDTSTCFDLAYEYTCQCKSGFVDQSTNKKAKPGRVCVPSDGTFAVAAVSTTSDPIHAPGAPPNLAPETPDEDPTDLPSGSLKVPETKDGVPKILSPDSASRDDGNDTKTGRALAGTSKVSSVSHPDSGSKSTTLAPSGDKKTDDDLKEQFKVIDTTKDGKVSFVELKAALTSNKMDVREDRVKSMMKAADVNSDGVVTFEEFHDLLTDQRKH